MALCLFTKFGDEVLKTKGKICIFEIEVLHTLDTAV